jgi:hypothetical protein
MPWSVNVPSPYTVRRSRWFCHDGEVFESRLGELGLVLPEPPRMPAGVGAAFSWVRVVGDRVLARAMVLRMPMAHLPARSSRFPPR